MRRRPTTVLGLTWWWLRTCHPRVLFVTIAMTVLALGATLAAHRTNASRTAPTVRRVAKPGACRLDYGRTWRAGVEEYDYTDTLEFRSNGKGEWDYGYAQQTRLIILFRYRVLQDGLVELSDFVDRHPGDGTETPLDWPPERVPYRITEGSFRFVEDAPYAPVEREYRCRLDWGTDDEDSIDYYGMLVSERPAAARVGH